MKRKILIIIILLLLIMAGIIHDRVVASRDKGMATDWNADHKITGDVDQDQNQFLNAVIENRDDWPAGPVAGQQVYRTDLNAVYFYDGTGWVGSNKRLRVWGCGGNDFIPIDYNTGAPTANCVYGPGSIKATADHLYFEAPVLGIPHGAIVTAAEAYGIQVDPSGIWLLMRVSFATGLSQIMASGNFNAEDITINFPTINNEDYGYYFMTYWTLTDHIIYGARIKYTL